MHRHSEWHSLALQNPIEDHTETTPIWSLRMLLCACWYSIWLLTLSLHLMPWRNNWFSKDKITFTTISVETFNWTLHWTLHSSIVMNYIDICTNCNGKWFKHQDPLSISYREPQVTWNFSSRSLDRFLSSLQVTWKPSHLAKSHVTSVADLEISWVALASLIVFCIFPNSYMWHNLVRCTIYVLMGQFN